VNHAVAAVHLPVAAAASVTGSRVLVDGGTPSD
jgi:hypothetical protein